MAFHPYPQLIPSVFNRSGFGPTRGLTRASTWPWVDHSASGLEHATTRHRSAPRPVRTRFRYGYPTRVNLATHRKLAGSFFKRHAVTRMCKHIPTLPRLVGTRFQVLFHSAPAVLFTIPSRYYPLSVTREYLGLAGGPARFTRDFSGPVLLGCLSNEPLTFRLRGSYPLRRTFRMSFAYINGF